MPVSLSANDFFANRIRSPRPKFLMTVLALPSPARPYPEDLQRRESNFFSWGYEYIKDIRQRNNSVRTVPTDAMKNGDFSSLLAIGPQYQIFNPFSRRPNPARPGFFILDPFSVTRRQSDCANSQRDSGWRHGVQQAAFSIDQPGREVLVDQFWPSPLNPASSADGSNNYLQPDLVETTRYFTTTVRIDHAFNDKEPNVRAWQLVHKEQRSQQHVPESRHRSGISVPVTPIHH